MVLYPVELRFRVLIALPVLTLSVESTVHKEPRDDIIKYQNPKENRAHLNYGSLFYLK